MAQYSAAIQIIGSALLVLALGWAAKRAMPKKVGEWTYSNYPLLGKLIALLGVVFITAAHVYNGLKLFESDWWVPPIIIVMTVGFYWLAYEMFVTTLRWNTTVVELLRPPLRPKVVRFSEVDSLKLHPTTESVTIRSTNGTKLWFPHSFRTGMPQLFTALTSVTAEENYDSRAEA
ncbi:hypothetical protein HLB44_36470 [Aquincola sp. S2]|uniref:PH domain-containing protein n=1 Tax=Pseudaquabacterium terrae TaxID=2732868 RepID=A0ABX2EVL3_9BURK|nr:hypothetical protein [Aquabacterium terrae]NRF72459.1 hypothetical protein [Aquabacterium terrae]